jgi:hypothetical protein
MGPQKAPSGKSHVVPIGAALAQRLAYYSSEQGFGVLAPRGWYCFGTYGSGGVHLFVGPQPVSARNLFSDDWVGFLGPAIQLNHSFGDTSGRFTVAEVIARVFPAYRWFATSVMNELTPPAKFPFGPDPKETVTHKGATVVEYSTPALEDGLGTHFWIKKNGDPIEGVAILIEQAPDLLLLAVRLPPELDGLSSAVVHQLEREAERLPQPKGVH